MKSISKWLSELGTHSIFDNDGIKKNFTEETGEAPPWGNGLSHKEMQAAIVGRGKGGELSKDKGQRFIGALSIASACYDQWAGEEKAGDKFGMGSQFWEYVSAIERNGR